MTRSLGLSPFVVAAVVAATLLSSTATAAATPAYSVHDDRLVTEPKAGQPSRAARVADLVALGATRVQLDLRWVDLAPKHRPAHAADPADPAYNWSGYDAAARAAATGGLEITMRIFATPEWAGGGLLHNYAPGDLADLRDFATAAGRRYSGRYVVPGADGPLPRVGFWVAWNEPNQPQFLTPQYRDAGGGTYVPASPHTYAGLLDAIYSGVRGGAQAAGADVPLVAGGATAGGGDANPQRTDARVPPAVFVAELAKDAPVMDAWAHHAYPLRGPNDRQPAGFPGIDAWNLPALDAALDAAGGRLAGLPIWVTENGVFVESVPGTTAWTDPEIGALWMEEAWRRITADPRVTVFGMYFLQDNEEWRTGLRDRAGTARPVWATMCRLFRGVDRAPRCPARDVEAERRAAERAAIAERERRYARLDFRPDTLALDLRVVAQSEVPVMSRGRIVPVTRTVDGRAVPVLERRLVPDDHGRLRPQRVPKERTRTVVRRDGLVGPRSTARLVGTVRTLDGGPLAPGTLRVMGYVDAEGAGHEWRRLGKVAFDATGRFSLPVRPAANTTYQAVVYESGGAQSELVRGRVQPSFYSFTATRIRVRPGGRAAFRARLLPPIDALRRYGVCQACAALARLQVNTGHHGWRVVEDALPVDSSGRVAVSHAFTAAETGAAARRPVRVRLSVPTGPTWPFAATVSPELVLNAPPTSRVPKT